jgi:membrane protein implicated in regulation of membrane protease activity
VRDVSLCVVLLILAIVALVFLPSPWGLVAVAAALALEVLEFFLWTRFLRRYRLRAGPELMVGTSATVVTECAPDGRVRVRGELWKARSSAPVEPGQTVRIAAISGLTLEVEPESPTTEKGPGKGPFDSEGRAASDTTAGPSVLKSFARAYRRQLELT